MHVILVGAGQGIIGFGTESMSRMVLLKHFPKNDVYNLFVRDMYEIHLVG